MARVVSPFLDAGYLHYVLNKRSVRLEAQDSGFSFLQHGFEFRTEYNFNQLDL